MELHIECDVPAGAASDPRCQLRVGHEGPHSALVIEESRRLLRRWDKAVAVIDVEFTSADAAGLPWAPGRPTAFTADSRPELTVVAGNPKVIRTANAGRLHIA